MMVVQKKLQFTIIYKNLSINQAVVFGLLYISNLGPSVNSTAEEVINKISIGLYENWFNLKQSTDRTPKN